MPIRVFVSYSHQDEVWKQRLMPLFLFPGSRLVVKPWDDKEIQPGVRWDDDIKRELAAMDVFVPLVSVNFAVSKYIQEVECVVAKRRHLNSEIEILPVLLDHPSKGDCAWLRRLQWVPPGSKSWVDIRSEFPDHDRAQRFIREGLKAVLKRAKEKRVGL